VLIRSFCYNRQVELLGNEEGDNLTIDFIANSIVITGILENEWREKMRIAAKKNLYSRISCNLNNRLIFI